MPTDSDDKQQKPEDTEPFKGVRQYVENNDVVGLMRELEKVPTETREAILNKLSISDGNDVIPMPDNILKQAQEQLKKKPSQDQGDVT